MSPSRPPTWGSLQLQLKNSENDRNTPERSPATQHIMHFIIHVLPSWPRQLAMHQLKSVIPPFIYRLQVENGISPSLAKCCTLARMRAKYMDGSLRMVQETLMNEVKSFLEEVIDPKIGSNEREETILTPSSPGRALPKRFSRSHSRY